MRTRTVIVAFAIAATTLTTLSAQAGPMFGRGTGMGMGHSGFGHGVGMRPGFGRLGVPANNPSALSRASKIEALAIKQKVSGSRKRNSITSKDPSNPQQGSDHGSVGLFQMQTR